MRSIFSKSSMMLMFALSLTACSRYSVESTIYGNGVKGVQYSLPKSLVEIKVSQVVCREKTGSDTFKLKNLNKNLATIGKSRIVSDGNNFALSANFGNQNETDLKIGIKSGLIQSTDITVNESYTKIFSSISQALSPEEDTRSGGGSDQKSAKTNSECEETTEEVIFSTEFDPYEAESVQTAETYIYARSNLPVSIKTVGPALRITNPNSNFDGIYYRNYHDVLIVLLDKSTNNILDSKYMPLVNRSVVGMYELRNVDLGDRSTKLVFSDGVLTESHERNTGSVQKYASIIGDGVKSLVALPGFAIRSAISDTNSKASLIESKAKLLEAEAKLKSQSNASESQKE